MTAGVQVGQPVVIRGRAIGTLVAIRDGMLVIEERDLEPGEESVLEVPIEQADKAVRAIASREQAVQAIRILATKPERPPTQERASSYRRAYKGGELEEQARMLAAIYAGPLEPQERQYIEQLERSVLGELALVLGVSRKALRAQIRARHDPHRTRPNHQTTHERSPVHGMPATTGSSIPCPARTVA